MRARLLSSKPWFPSLPTCSRHCCIPIKPMANVVTQTLHFPSLNHQENILLAHTLSCTLH